MAFFMDNITNSIKLHSGRQDQSYSFLRNIKIVEYNATTGRAKGALFNPKTEDWDIITNWMPILTWGNCQGTDAEAGAGLLCGQIIPPLINEWAYMVPFAGDLNSGIIIGGIYTDKRPPPTDANGQNALAGEWLYKHHSGSCLKFFDNGDVTLYVTGNYNIHVDGNKNEHVVGTITSGAESTMTLTGNSIMLNANAQVMSNAPGTNTSQNLSAGNGANGTFTTPTGQTVTVIDGIITNIY